jgi:hypothetical protein
MCRGADVQMCIGADVSVHFAAETEAEAEAEALEAEAEAEAEAEDLPNHLATTGVNATVGGNLIGLAALCTAYAKKAVPAESREQRAENREGVSG